MVYGSHQSPNVWWATKSILRPHSSYTWAGAENFYKYAIHSSKRAPLSPGRNAAHLRVGDILQYKEFNEKMMKHSMVVTKIVRGRIYLTNHASGNNRKNRPLDHKVFLNKHFYPLNV